MKIEQVPKSSSPCRVLQFGEGNFLRAFADYIFWKADRSGVYPNTIKIVKPIRRGSLDRFRSQNMNYTVLERGTGSEPGKGTPYVIDSVTDVIDPYADFGSFLALAEEPELRWVISNTTEAGIAYMPEDRLDDGIAESFPGKVVQLLHRRFQVFSGDPSKGLVFLPCELIDQNGDALKEIVLKLIRRDFPGSGLLSWVETSCRFCNTLVDRIVVGSPSDPADYFAFLGYEDHLLDICEPFLLWVIGSGAGLQEELPLARTGLNIVFTDDLKYYRERKVRILNGIHTAITPLSLMMGYSFVHEAVGDPLISRYIARLLDLEILPGLSLPASELIPYAGSVLDRFANPALRHRLASISLNSVSKWRTRILPSVLDAVRAGRPLPRGLSFSFTALAAYYLGNGPSRGLLIHEPDIPPADITDTEDVRAFFSRQAGGGPQRAEESIAAWVSRYSEMESFWGMSLKAIPGFEERVAADLEAISSKGMRVALEGVCHDLDHP